MTQLATVNNKGTRMNTPHLAKAITDGTAEYMKAGSDSLAEDWKGHQTHSCSPCKGSGVSPFEKMPCMGCDGSGKHYEVHYGVEDKKAFAYVVQFGLDGLKEYCKAMREAEVDTIRASKGMLKVFELPPYLRVDLIAEGWPIDDMMKGGDLRSLSNHIAAHYPEFMTTNLKTF